MKVPKTYPSSKRIITQVVDTDTAEIIYSADKTASFFCAANGEKYLHKVLDAAVNKLRNNNANLRIEFNIFPPITLSDLERDLWQGVTVSLD